MKKVKVIFVSIAVIAALFATTGVAGAHKANNAEVSAHDPGVGGDGG